MWWSEIVISLARAKKKNGSMWNVPIKWNGKWSSQNRMNFNLSWKQDTGFTINIVERSVQYALCFVIVSVSIGFSTPCAKKWFSTALKSLTSRIINMKLYRSVFSETSPWNRSLVYVCVFVSFYSFFFFVFCFFKFFGKRSIFLANCSHKMLLEAACLQFSTCVSLVYSFVFI